MTHKKYSLQTQSVSISKDKYTLDEAKKWLDEHGYKKSVEEGPEFYHFRQAAPSKSGVYVTKEITPGIELVLHRPSRPSENKTGGKRSSRRSSKRSSKKTGGRRRRSTRSSKRSSKKTGGVRRH